MSFFSLKAFCQAFKIYSLDLFLVILNWVYDIISNSSNLSNGRFVELLLCYLCVSL